jgi:Xaa-Pro dipeptidase
MVETARASLQERDRRWFNIRQELKRNGLDGLLIVSDAHIERRGSMRYVSDFNSRGMYAYVVFPVEGEPMAIHMRGAEGPWIRDSRILPLRGGWVPESEPYAPVIAEILKELKIEKGCLGIEGDFMPAPVYQRLVKELPDATFKQLNIIHELKMVKSPEEIKFVEKGTEMVDKGFETCLEVARPGKTWNEISSEVCKTFYDFGMEDIGGFLLPRSTSVMKSGDSFLFYPEIQAPGGYWIQFGRLVSFGKPNKELQEAWELSIEAQKRGAEKMKPGHTGADVMKAIHSALKGTKYTAALRGCGHGVALDVLEKPFISFDDETVLQPGMVMTIHPIFSPSAPYPVLVADTFIVTEDEPRKLSMISPEIKVI